MVAIMVVATFLALILIDQWRRQRAGVRATEKVHLSEGFLAMPEDDFTVTHNHLKARSLLDGTMTLCPDSFALAASGAGATVTCLSAGKTFLSGDELFRIEWPGGSVTIAAPFDGTVASVAAGAAHVRPSTDRAAISALVPREELASYWKRETERLQYFVGESLVLSGALADGGHLAPGFLRHMPLHDIKTFRRRFLAATGH